jgi:acetyltransferase-like isoleucine patch superfamily enzyme
MNLLRRFLDLPFWEKINALSYFWALLKTQTVYRFAFGEMGKGTVIRSPIMLNNTRFVYLGKNVSIQHGARIDIVTERYGYSFQPRVIIGDGASFEQNFHLACAQEIVIGNKVAVTENVGIFDIWHPYQDVTRPIVDQPLQTAPVHIGEGSLIGMGAVIQPGVTIGRHCLIGANSVVTHDIPDFTVAVGAPAQALMKYDIIAERWIKTLNS